LVGSASDPMIRAVASCHPQGYVHRDEKSHNCNFVDRTAHVQLIDFNLVLLSYWSPARVVPKEYCCVPCGTCDYVIQEILQAHESASLPWRYLMSRGGEYGRIWGRDRLAEHRGHDIRDSLWSSRPSRATSGQRISIFMRRRTR